MAFLRVYLRMDTSNKIALPRGIRKALDIKPGDRLELSIVPKGVLLRSITFPNAVIRRSKVPGSRRDTGAVSTFGAGCRTNIRKAAAFGVGTRKGRKLLVAKRRRYER